MEKPGQDVIESPFEIKSLEEAATYDYLELQQGLKTQEETIQRFFQSSYLEQVYFLIQDAIYDKGWKPLDITLMCKWEDHLWKVFLHRRKELFEFIPNCDTPGYTMAGIFWIILCGLSLLNHTWRPEKPWKKVYNQGASGKDLPYVLHNFLVLCDKPIMAHTTHDLMGQLFTLTSRIYEVEYHLEIEIWILWLQTRTAELMYTVSTREMYNSAEYCAPRPSSSTLFGVSDAFIQETARLFAELRGMMMRYRIYPRARASCSREAISIRLSQIAFPSVDDVEFPIEEDENSIPAYHHAAVSQYFFADKEIDGPEINKRWSRFVTKNLQQFYHDRSRKTLHQQGLIHALRPGEMARSCASNQGISPGEYEILKKNRPIGALDNLDFHAFKMSWETLYKYSTDLTRGPDRIRDAALLYLLDQYLHHEYSMSFTREFCKQEYNWEQDLEGHEHEEHPILLQTLGGWDVYCRGQIIQTRNVMKAFIVWCYQIFAHFDGRVFKAVILHPMLKQILMSENAEEARNESPLPVSALTSRAYWI